MCMHAGGQKSQSSPALEQHSLTIEVPKEVKKMKNHNTNMMNYICGRIEGSNTIATITHAVYEDLVKYTTYTDGDDVDAVDMKRK